MYLKRLGLLSGGLFCCIEGDGNPGAGGDAAVIEKDPPGGDDAAAAGDVGAGGDQGGGDAAVLESLAEGDEGDAPASPWPEDWREQIAQGDEDALKALKKFGSINGVWKKLVNQEKLIRSGAHKAAPTLGDNPTPEEVAAYRKAAGIPEAPEGYGLAFPAELKVGEAQKGILAGFQQFAHERNLPPAAVNAAFDWYKQHIAQTAEAQAEAVKEWEIEARAELRKEFPAQADLKRNLGIANEFLDQHDLIPLMQATLPNGRPVVYDPTIIKAIIAMARSYADEDALIGGDGAGGGKSIDDEIAELVNKSAGTRLTEAEDARLTQLYEARVARDERRGRRAA